MYDVPELLRQIGDRVGSLKFVIAYCSEQRPILPSLAKVVSVAFIELFSEMKDYLDDHENDIAARHGLDPRIEELRLREAVLDPFVKAIREDESRSLDRALEIIEALIIDWDTFSKETMPGSDSSDLQNQ